MKILLTAFDPFGGETVNPAQEALKQIQAPAPDMELIKLVVPTVFGASTQAVHEAMVLHQPVLSFALDRLEVALPSLWNRLPSISWMPPSRIIRETNHMTSLYLRTARMGIFPRFLSRIWWLPSVTPEFRLPSLIPQAHSCAIS